MTHETSKNRLHHIVTSGGGTAGLSVAATLLRQSSQLDVAVIDPSDEHDYQPGWTLVGGGDMRAEDCRRRQADVMPDKATWVKGNGQRLRARRQRSRSGVRRARDLRLLGRC